MQTRSALTSIFVILCACVCAPAQAEQPAPPRQHDAPGAIACSLVNGDRISGKVVDVSPAAISLATELLGTLTVPRAAVSSCQAEDGEPQLSLPFLGAAGGAPAAGAGTNTAAAAVNAGGQQQGGAPPAADAASAEWKRSLSFSYAFASGNADVSDMNVAGAASRKSEAGLLTYPYASCLTLRHIHAWVHEGDGGGPMRGPQW